MATRVEVEECKYCGGSGERVHPAGKDDQCFRCGGSGMLPPVRVEGGAGHYLFICRYCEIEEYTDSKEDAVMDAENHLKRHDPTRFFVVGKGDV